MDTLSEDQVREFRAAFALFDRDGEGMITTRELGALIRAAGGQASEAQLQDMVNQVDMQGDGVISFIDFLTLMAHHVQEEEEAAAVQGALKVFDRDGHGQIATAHFRSVMRQMGGEITDTEISEIMQEADPYRTGKVEYKAFMEKLITR